MNSIFPQAKVRLVLFIAVALLHVFLLLLVAFHMESSAPPAMPVAAVMRLVNVEEEIPPPPEKLPDEPYTNTMESIAETMIETDVVTPPIIGYVPPQAETEQIQYLPQSQITVLPVLPESEIVRATVYPPIAQRSNIEGVVYLELFIDRQGNVRDVRILRENPQGRGFGEAAVNAFKGIRGKPAEANGTAVAVRYRYNINFRLN